MSGLGRAGARGRSRGGRVRSRAGVASPRGAPPIRPPSGLRVQIEASRISQRVRDLGAEIAGGLRARERPVAVVVLQGAFVFAADLVRAMPQRLGLEVAFLRCESYGRGMRSRGRVVLLQDLDAGLSLRGRTVLLVDDILDTGLTLRFLRTHLLNRGAARVLTCVLLWRAGRRRGQGVAPDYYGFAVGPEFFVGYGLDHAGRHRHLPYLAALGRGD